MRKLFQTRAEAWISSLGLLALGALFLHWRLVNNTANHAGRLMAGLSVLLFAWGCLQFVRQWMAFWSGRQELSPESAGEKGCAVWKVGLLSLLAALMELGLILALRAWMGDPGGLEARLRWFAGIDTGNYMDIARYWYAPTPLAEERRLAFYPLYPLLTRGLWLLGLELYTAGTLVAVLFYSLSNCVLYRLLCLDYPEERARSVMKYTALLPAAFFFAAPMSESVFFFWCLLSYYLARKGRWLGAGAAGALAAFARSLGVLVFAPLLFEAVAAWIREPGKTRRGVWRVACCFLVLLGLAGYLWINYRYYGDPFHYMEVEAEHWGQRMGLFFRSVAFQTDNALADIQQPYALSSLGIWIPNVLWIMAALLLFALTGGKLRASYGVWFIVYAFFALAPTFLISAPRYLVAAVPVYPALASLGLSRRLDRALALLCALAALVYILAFVNGMGVY